MSAFFALFAALFLAAPHVENCHPTAAADTEQIERALSLDEVPVGEIGVNCRLR
jgi:hypothetical protein